MINMRERGIHRKATFEDRFYRHWTCGKKNHNSGWSKDKKRVRRNFRLFLKYELRKEKKDEGID